MPYLRARNCFQSDTANLFALSDKNAHSGFGLVCSLEASIHADAYSLNVGASPLLSPNQPLARTSGNGAILKPAVGQIFEEGDPLAIFLVVLAVKQAIALADIFRKRIKANDSCGKTSLLQNDARLQQMSNSVQHHALSIDILRHSSAAVSGFHRNLVWNRMTLDNMI